MVRLFSNKNTSFLYEGNMNSFGCLEIFKKKTIQENKFKFRNYKVLLQIDNARYQWTTCVLKFCNDNKIKIVCHFLYLSDLNLIVNIRVSIKKNLMNKSFQKWIYIKKKENLWNQENIYDGMIKRNQISILIKL